MNGRKIFEYSLDITNVVDTGVCLDDILSGKKEIPAQGIRVDVSFDGIARDGITGRVYGVDYICIRADGRINLDIRAMIETDTGERIAISADGVANVRNSEPVADLYENVILSTASKKYAWVNTHQVWAKGTVDFSAGKIFLEAYVQSPNIG